MKLSSQTFNRILLIIGILYAVSFLERIAHNYSASVADQKHLEKVEQFEIKINNYEESIFKDSVIVSNSSRSYRDSIRAALNPR